MLSSCPSYFSLICSSSFVRSTTIRPQNSPLYSPHNVRCLRFASKTLAQRRFMAVIQRWLQSSVRLCLLLLGSLMFWLALTRLFGGPFSIEVPLVFVKSFLTIFFCVFLFICFFFAYWTSSLQFRCAHFNSYLPRLHAQTPTHTVSWAIYRNAFIINGILAEQRRWHFHSLPPIYATRCCCWQLK